MSDATQKMEAARERIVAERPLCALVTGASSGIGEAFARLMAKKGHDVVLVARREELLTKLAAELQDEHPIKASVIVQDLGEPTAPKALADRLSDLGLEIDILYNNAGYTMDGHYLSYDYEEHRRYQQVMALTPAELTYLVLPGMLRRGFGRIINVASVAGLMPSTPFNAMYGPCKNHMIVLARTLQIEYGEAGVQFSVVCPGPVKDTSIINTQHGQAWSRFGFILSDVQEVAERSWDSSLAGKMLTPVGASTKSSAAMGRFLPTDLWSRMAAQGIMFLGKEKPIRSAADAGVE